MKKHLLRLDEEIRKVCLHLFGVGIDNPNLPFGPGNVKLDFKPEATQIEKDAALAVLLNFQWTDVALADWKDDKNPDKKTLLQEAQRAVLDIDSYLALPTPSPAQNSAFLKRVAQILKPVVKRLIQLD